MIRFILILTILSSCTQDDKLVVAGTQGPAGIDGESCKVEEGKIQCPGQEAIILNTSGKNIEKCTQTNSNHSLIICGNLVFKGLPQDGSSCSTEPTDMGAKIVCTDGTEAYVFNGKDGADGQNGSDGQDGLDGADGKDGSDGADGQDGIDGQDGKNGKDGKDGLNGKNGKDGKDGKDGINGSSCKVVDHKEGAEIICGNSSEVIYDGKNGKCTNCCKKQVCEITKSGNHTVWFSSTSKLPNDFVFSPFGVWEQDSTGLVRVTGYISSQSKPDYILHIDIMFKNMTKIAPAGSPKQPNPANAPLTDWYYYKNFSGIMVGEGELEGLVLEISQHGPVMQVGTGASIHNPLFGAASWFTTKVINKPSHGPKVYDSAGDFNWTLTCY